METKKSATDAKTADDKSLGKDAPKSQVDVKTSAEAMLNPADNSVIERSESSRIDGVKPGSSYPTPEAVQAESEAKQKLIEERQAKEAEEATKAQGGNEFANADARKLSGAGVTRSAIDQDQVAVMHPGAKPDPKAK